MGRKRKEGTLTTIVDRSKVLKEFEEMQRLQLESLYKELAVIKHLVQTSLNQVGFMDEVESVAQAAFKAGRAYGPLDEANDKIEEILERIYGDTDLDHWDDVTTCNC
jgi:hypothetical protein